MMTYPAAFALSMLVALLLTPLVTKLAHARGWYDMPSGGRKIHSRPIPRVGGLAVVTAFFAPLVGLAIYNNRISNLLYADLDLFSTLCLGATAIVMLGIYDDLRGADAKKKLIVQSLVALGMWWGGFRMELLGNPFGEAFELGALSLPLTMLWIVGVINALNLIDGLDGLASGTALFASIVLFGVAFVDNGVLLCVLMASLGGALVGFLFYNFNPAKIFLGDSGSMFLGFILAAASLWTQVKAATAVALIIPVIALGLPILDTTLSFARRLARGQSPFRADGEHVHHRLMALGLSHRNTVVTLYTLSGIFALGALALLDSDYIRRAIVLSTVAAVVFILVRRIGFTRVPGIVHRGTGSTAATRDLIRIGARRIRGARDMETAWRTTVEVLGALGCDEIQLTWTEPVSQFGERREQVLMWRRRDRGEWRLRDPMLPADRRGLLELREEDELFGELCVLRPQQGNRSLGAEVALELTRDAIIDFCVSRQDHDAKASRSELREAIAGRPDRREAAPAGPRIVSLSSPQEAPAPELRSV